jgi:anti-anti-sigma factor
METLTLPASLDSLQSFSDFALRIALQSGLGEHASWEVQLAVDEAVTNIVQYAYVDGGAASISLTCEVTDQGLLLTIHDTGKAFDPSAIPAPDLSSSIDEREAGGLGMYLMRKLMDQVDYHFDPVVGNRLTMLKRRAGGLPHDLRIVPLSGRIDAAAAPKMAEQVRAALAEGGRRLVLDFAQVSFLSSSGLRMLLLLARELKTLHGHMHLCALPPQIAEVFELTGFHQIFPIHRTREEALAACGLE